MRDPCRYIGWLGVVVLFTFLAWMLGNWKVGLLTLCGLLFMGLQGLWQDSMETLALTIAAVTISLLIGIPLGIWAGMSDGFNRIDHPGIGFHADPAVVRVSRTVDAGVPDRSCRGDHRDGDLCRSARHPPYLAWHSVGTAGIA